MEETALCVYRRRTAITASTSRLVAVAKRVVIPTYLESAPDEGSRGISAATTVADPASY